MTVREMKELELKEMKRNKEKNLAEYNLDDIEVLEKELKEIKENPNHIAHTEIFMLKGKHNKLFRKAEKASITGDTIGDPMKDTSGPSLNILIKLSSIISVVFGTLFVNTSYFVKN